MGKASKKLRREMAKRLPPPPAPDRRSEPAWRPQVDQQIWAHPSNAIIQRQPELAWQDLPPEERYRRQWEPQTNVYAAQQNYHQTAPFFQQPYPAPMPPPPHRYETRQYRPYAAYPEARHPVPFRPTPAAWAPHERHGLDRHEDARRTRSPRRNDWRPPAPLERQPRGHPPQQTAVGNSSGSSTPVPFARRQKTARQSGAPDPPTKEYLDSTNAEPSTFSMIETPAPPLLILDLNNTLLCRIRSPQLSTAKSSKHPIVRPYLSTFLQYVCGSDEGGKRRWTVAVYSSAALHNVLSLLEAVRLVDVERAHVHGRVRRGEAWESREDDALDLVWSRERMGLTEQEFALNVETVKNLDEIWDAMDGFGSARSVLLDDEAGKAAQHPYNHVPILPFIIDPSSVALPRPRSRSPSPRRQDGRNEREGGSPVPRYDSRGDMIADPVQLPPNHTFYDDTSLLSTIYVLEQLKSQRNMGAFIRQKGLQDGLAIKDEKDRVEAGRAICRRLGIEITRGWKEGWWQELSAARYQGI